VQQSVFNEPKRSSSKAIEKRQAGNSPPENALHSSQKKEKKKMTTRKASQKHNPEPIRILFSPTLGKRFSKE
jgi:hypothetical protein